MILEKPKTVAKGEMQFHPVADLFPMMSADEFEVLCLDIATNGLHEPIMTAADPVDGIEKIADGRNRFKACAEVKVPPRYRAWNGEGSLIDVVVSLNLKRRHLSESQRAMVAAKMANMKQGRNANTADAVFVSQSTASKLLNVSADSISRAAKIQKEGVPELVEWVETGEMSVSAASELAKMPKSRQKDIVKRGRKAAREILSKIKANAVRQAAHGRAVCIVCGPGIDDTAVNFSAAIQLVGERFPLHSRYLADVVEEMAQEDLSDTTRASYERIFSAIRSGDAEHNDCRRASGLTHAEFEHAIAIMLDYKKVEVFYQGGKTETARGARKKIYRISTAETSGDLTYEMFDDDDGEDLPPRHIYEDV